MEELKKIKPGEINPDEIENGKIIEDMVTAIYDWIKLATVNVNVTVTVPVIPVQVAVPAGTGATTMTVTATGTGQGTIE